MNLQKVQQHLSGYSIAEIRLVNCKVSDSYNLDNFYFSPIDKYDKILEQESVHNGNTEDGSTTLMPGQTLQGTEWMMRRPSELHLSDLCKETLPLWVCKSLNGNNNTPRNNFANHEHEDSPSDYSPLPSIRLSTRDVTRWNMAWRSFCAIRQEILQDGKDNLVEATSIIGRGPIFQRCKNWPLEHELNDRLIVFGFTTAGLIYGGLHALAWLANFHSPTEQLLWRVSACVVMGGFPVIFIMWLVVNQEVDKDWILWVRIPSLIFFFIIGPVLLIGTSISGNRVFHQSLSSSGRRLRRSKLVCLFPSHLLGDFLSTLRHNINSLRRNFIVLLRVFNRIFFFSSR